MSYFSSTSDPAKRKRPPRSGLNWPLAGIDGAGAVFILPPAYRPQHSHAFVVSCGSQVKPGEHTEGRMSVYPDGRVVHENADDCSNGSYLSPAGIRFDAG